MFGEATTTRMALNSCSCSSSSAACPPHTKHDVFLSFRGEDTRYNFTSHLHAALCEKKIQTFIDDDLNRGEEISPSILKAIEESKISMIIFSKDFASSAWCLDEVVKILECKQEYGRVVIPVFYNIDPSIVRKQTGSYENAFVKHEKKLKDNMDKVKRWKAALTAAANYSGWDSMKIRPESALVRSIVEDILAKLNCMSTSGINGLVGIEKHIVRLKSLQDIGQDDVRIVGIWGIGGIGKTTLAEAIFHKLASQFNSSIFIHNVQGQIEKQGVNNVRNKYFSAILKEIKERLRRIRVLLVLDDVNSPWQIEDLVGGHDVFALGSRIIMTSRDLQVLQNVNANEIYELKEMNFEDSFQLFCLTAFKQNHPTEGYMELSRMVVNYAGGHPLTIKVLGSNLYQRAKQNWEIAIRKLEKAPNNKIFDVVKLSYDGLDDEQKEIFLDVACFYNGQDMNAIKKALRSFGFSVYIGICALIDRGLVANIDHKIMMHDLIEEMGQEIVRQQSIKEPGKRSRLWKLQDVCPLLEGKKGTEAVQCIYLNLCETPRINLHPSCFKKMNNLRLLQFYKPNPNENSKVCISKGLMYLPNGLRLLHWDEWPLEAFPLNFSPENLVKLVLRESRLKKLWDKNQVLPNLRSIDLGSSKHLTELPDLSQMPNIEEINLSNCIRLSKVYSSSDLSELSNLWLDGCIGLRKLTLCTSSAFSAGSLVLYKCKNLKKFILKIDGREIMLLKDSSSVSTFEPKIESAGSASDEPEDNINLNESKLLREGLSPSHNELCCFDLSFCESLGELPESLFGIKALRSLNFRGSSMLERLPSFWQPMENLRAIVLDETSIRELPGNIFRCFALEELSLRMCRRLESIPYSIGVLIKLRMLDLRYCDSLRILPSSIFNLRISRIDLSDCSMLEKLPEILKTNISLRHLCLKGTAIKNLPTSLDRLVELQNLDLEMCRNLEFVPNSICNMTHLTQLNLSGCSSLSRIPTNIGYLSMMRELSLRGCDNIVNLPESIVQLSSLRSLDIRDCSGLESLPKLPPSVHVLDCPSMKRVSSQKEKGNASCLQCFQIRKNKEKEVP